MFKSVNPKLDVPAMEDNVLKFWTEQEIFKKTVDQRQGKPDYVFYEGPPTANGRPGVHHVLARAFKDMFPRYKIMRGYHVSRRGGWDTHGLPVEIEVEKQLGFTNKQQIEEYGVDKFNELCKKSVFNYIQEWEKLTDRIGFWVDLETAYVTYTNDYIESVWWILKNFWEKDLLFKGYKIVPYCPRCGTPLSDHEVALGYEDAEDPSVFVRFPLVDKPDTYLLVWTTTPWTLPSNVAVAAHPDVDYVTVEHDNNGVTEKLILAKSLLEKVFRGEEVKVLDTYKGKKLDGLKYQPLYTFMPVDKPAYYVVMGDYVTTEDGTGLVHTAPAFGQEDMETGKKYDLPVLLTVQPDGAFIPEITPWRGIFVKEADPLIIQELEARGLMFRSERFTHTYPFCWRCKTPLLYYARESWYIRTSAKKDSLVGLNKTIHWVPDHIQNGRFGNWLENNIDWSLSRERYWGTPLPVWECDGCHDRECVGSVAELSEKAGKDLTELDLHRPHVDNIHWGCAKCGGQMTRVKDLIDVWFDSGSMPYAQWHYPFENKDKFEAQYPADYICEAVDQTRGWFYSLHAISTLLNDQVSFKNVICLGHIQDEKGRKMSKSLGNIVQPWDVINLHGADALRWYLYTATPPGQERRFSSDLVGEVIRNFTLTLWNVYSFFVTYANLDKPQALNITAPANDLDRWLLSELNVLVRDVTKAYEEYDVTNATRPVEKFVETLSTWYVRRSRRRFWKNDSPADKQSAYSTLYTALVTVAKLIAPAMPFLAEELYQNLVCSVDEGAPESIHLAEWPVVMEEFIDESLNREMNLVMKLVSLGHSARQKANRKVRQPLAEAAFSVGNVFERDALLKNVEVVQDELNVKQVRLLDAATEAVSHTVKPLPKQLGQKYGNKFPVIQKAILAMNAEEVAKALLSGNPLEVKAGGETFHIISEEVEVKAMAKEGFAVAEDGAYVAALVTTLTPELVAEGLAREFVRRVQDLRKTANLDVADRIELFVEASVGLKSAVETHADYIKAETLTVKFSFAAAPANASVVEDAFEGETLKVGLIKN
ncbi:MAG: isoleucine--tRNA ligase [Anaerolineales bacterium]|nr:isoleucine--tRNA ligase [Anaerolineales bacterium]MCB9143832.1 isoleucine--tRNA ligase [Anaerolineales bacterium]